MKSSQWLNSRLYNARFGWQLQNYFAGKARQTLKVSKNILDFFGVFYNFHLKYVESVNQILREIDGKFGQQIQNNFSGKEREGYAGVS